MRSKIHHCRPNHRQNRGTQSSCLLCFRELNLIRNLTELLSDRDVLCVPCRKALKVTKHQFKVGSLTVQSLYEYASDIQNLLIRYKESGDMALKDLFLTTHRPWFKRRYRGYLGILVPSHEQHIALRGFNHLPLIYQDTIDLFEGVEKTSSFRQMAHSSIQRQDISFSLTTSLPKGYRGYVILDDVITTGATMQAVAGLFEFTSARVSAFSIAFHPFFK